MNHKKISQGLDLLHRPVMPLVSMVQFLYLTGPFDTVGEVIGELPEPIDTEYVFYERPVALMREYLPRVQALESLKSGRTPDCGVIDEHDEPVDRMTAVSALVAQQVLTAELEQINSLLCGPCNCTLCCVGPDNSMNQEFFEIPLARDEVDLFAVERYDDEKSRSQCSGDEDELDCDGLPFYRRRLPGLFHWRTGWSLILPRDSRCPNLEADGRCKVYPERPAVCRRPQIFPYMLEPLDTDQGAAPVYRLRQSLLAVVDCPYVRDFKDDIARYAAASELHLVLKENKN